MWQFTIGKKLRLATRDHPERLQMFGREVQRMTRLLEARDTPFVLAFFRWRNRLAVREDVPRGPGKRFTRRLVDLQAALAGEPKEDLHYTASAHRKMAALFCQVISQCTEGCVPPGWRREVARRR